MTAHSFKIILFLLCQSITVLLCVESGEALNSRLLSTLVVESTLLGILLFWLPKKLSSALRLVFSVVLYLLALTDLYCQEVFEATLSPHILAMILQTDSAEVADFFSAYAFTFLKLGLFHILLLIIVLHVMGVLMADWLTRRWNVKLSRQQRIIAVSIWAVFVIVCIPLAFSVKYDFHTLVSQPTMSDMEGVIFRTHGEAANTPLWRLLYALRGSQLARCDIERQKETAQHVVIDSCLFRSPTIVLVIGESYNRHHSQLYGYPLATTPRQVELRDSGQLYVFTDVVTTWNITSNAFTQMFSLYSYGTKGQWGDYPLFPHLFRRAGYQVLFLSNQYVQRSLSSGNETGGFFLNDHEVCDSLFDIRNYRKYPFDALFFNRCQREMAMASDTSLTILHLHGQHFEYAQRFPSDAKYFTKHDYQQRSLTNEQRQIVADYDNATRYNDEVIAQVLQCYADRSAIVIYLSDHGEECYDDLMVHGRLYQDLDKRQVRQEFEIPFWIWCSPRYQQEHPDVVQRIQNAVHRPFMTDHLPHILLWLAGISCPYYEEQHNLLSPSFDVNRPRMLEGTVDYDALMYEK